MTMDEATLEEFLTRSLPAPLGVIASLRSDGSPHVLPVWFRWHESQVRIWSSESRIWVRGLLRDPRVAFTVHTSEPGLPAVMIRGRAAVVTDAEDTVDQAVAIARRYLATGAEEYVAGKPDLRSIVSITPEHIVSWADADVRARTLG